MSEPTDFDTYTLVLLRRPVDAPRYSDDELTKLQRGHLAFLERMRADGRLLVAGPLSDQLDETLRGICLYRTGLQETRRLAEQDPAVRAGRLAVDAMTLWTPRGALAFPLAGEAAP